MNCYLTIQNYQRDALNIIYSSNIIILLYMFRVSSTHLQEDIVVHLWSIHDARSEKHYELLSVLSVFVRVLGEIRCSGSLLKSVER